MVKELVANQIPVAFDSAIVKRMLSGSLKSAFTTALTRSFFRRDWEELEFGSRDVATIVSPLAVSALITDRPCLPVALNTR